MRYGEKRVRLVMTMIRGSLRCAHPALRGDQPIFPLHHIRIKDTPVRIHGGDDLLPAGFQRDGRPKAGLCHGIFSLATHASGGEAG